MDSLNLSHSQSKGLCKNAETLVDGTQSNDMANATIDGADIMKDDKTTKDDFVDPRDADHLRHKHKPTNSSIPMYKRPSRTNDLDNIQL